MMELRDWTRERLMEGADLAEWRLMRKKDRITPILKEALGVMLSPEIAEEEGVAIAQDSTRARDWARRRFRAHGMNLKQAEALEQERWIYCTRGTINGWFDDFSGLLAGVNPDMRWTWARWGSLRPEPALWQYRRIRHCTTEGA
jgi:hypothetical protein